MSEEDDGPRASPAAGMRQAVSAALAVLARAADDQPLPALPPLGPQWRLLAARGGGPWLAARFPAPGGGRVLMAAHSLGGGVAATAEFRCPAEAEALACRLAAFAADWRTAEAAAGPAAADA